jgi:hypothetical protein
MDRTIGGWEFLHIHYTTLWVLIFVIVLIVALAWGRNGRDK